MVNLVVNVSSLSWAWNQANSSMGIEPTIFGTGCTCWRRRANWNYGHIQLEKLVNTWKFDRNRTNTYLYLPFVLIFNVGKTHSCIRWTSFLSTLHGGVGRRKMCVWAQIYDHGCRSFSRHMWHTYCMLTNGIKIYRKIPRYIILKPEIICRWSKTQLL